MSAPLAELKNSVLEGLYDIEHEQFARRLGLLTADAGTLSADLLRNSIRVLDELSVGHGDVESVSTIVALVWEYASTEQKRAIRSFFILVLTRVGLSPTTFLVDPALEDSGNVVHNGYLGSSIKEEIAITLLQASAEVRIGHATFLLSSFQKRLIDKVAEAQLVCVSAPTSAGKSFALNLCIARYAHGADLPVVYVVPTISLVNQVAADIRRLFDDQVLGRWKISISGAKIVARTVYVLTQERAINIFSEGGYPGRLGMLLVDEVQNLERVGDEAELRSKILFDFMRDARNFSDKIIISGPRLDEIGVTGETVFHRPAVEVETKTSPVANLTYAIGKHGTNAYLIQHRPLIEGEASLRIDVPEIVQGQGQSRYTDGFLDYLGHLLSSLGDDSRNIIFSPTGDQARKTALSLPGFASEELPSDLRSSLSDYLSYYVHPAYDLASCVRRGVAFHTSKVPPHARLAVEQAFGDGQLKDVVCTTTLMQGVNLPATVVLIRNPRLAIKQRSGATSVPSLSAYDFANLRGRAGRLSKDFIGRTVALDESSFSSHVQEDLFSEGRKALRPGYGDLFDSNRNGVVSDLSDPQPDAVGAIKFLAGYVRHAIFRHGESAAGHLKSIGIGLTNEEFNQAKLALSQVTLDRAKVLMHRYWDPIDLQVLSDTYEGSNISLPESVWIRNLADALCLALEFMGRSMPYYWFRYFKVQPTSSFVFSLAKTAESWCRELPLRKIVDARHFDPEQMGERINDQMGIIFREVTFGLPALLRPLYSLAGVGDGLLTSIESGAYSPVTFFLMSLGIYREMAVSLREKFASDIANVDDDEGKGEIVRRIRGGLSSLDLWTRRQVEPAIFGFGG